MKCIDTAGLLPAIHIDDEVIYLARDLQPIIQAIRDYGHGEGEISIKVQRNKIPFIDWTVRTFRKLTTSER